MLGAIGDPHVAPGLLEVPGDDRDQQHERGADRERDAPAVVAEVGEREQDHREAEPGAERQRVHAGRERPGAFGRVLDRGDAGDDQHGVDQRAVEQLRAGEHLERRRERGEQVGRARADQPDQDQAAPTPAVGERDGDQRHQHAGPGDGRARRPSAWSERPNALVTASPFWESSAPQKLASRATAASAPRRAACSGVNGTGGTTGRGFSGGGGRRVGGRRVQSGRRRGGARGGRPSHAWSRRNQVKNGTTTSLTATEPHLGRRTAVADDDRGIEARAGVGHAADRALVAVDRRRSARARRRARAAPGRCRRRS